MIQKTFSTCAICTSIKNLYFSEYFLFLWQMGVLFKIYMYTYDMRYGMRTLLTMVSSVLTHG